MYQVLRVRFNRREALRIERIVIITLVAFFLIIMGVIIGSNFLASSKSKAAESEVTYKYFTSVEVQSGDSLWSIASASMTDEYADVNEYVKEIQELNHLGSNPTIHTGEYLMIPYYSNEAL